MKTVTAIIERGTDGTYDIHFAEDNDFSFALLGQGKTVSEAKKDFLICKEDMRELYTEEGKPFPEFDIEYKYDTIAFLSSYAKTMSFVGLELITGVNRHQLSQYVNGYRNPSPKTTEKIEQGIKQFAEELSHITFA